MPVTCVAVDLDGTLLTSLGSITARTQHAIRLALGVGIAVVAVTARPMMRCRELLAAGPPFSAYVTHGGALVTDRPDTSEPLLLDGFSADEARHILALVAKIAPDAGLAVDCMGVRLANRLWVDPSFTPTPTTVVADLATCIADPVLSVLVRQPATMQDAIMDALSGDKNQVRLSGPDFFEIQHANIDKASGLGWFMASNNIAWRDVIAVGNDTTDIPMFRVAGYAVAVANAVPGVRTFIDTLIPGNDDDGVAKLLEFLTTIYPYQGQPAHLADYRELITELHAQFDTVLPVVADPAMTAGSNSGV